MATGLVAVEFVWHHSIARPRKTPVIRKDLRLRVSTYTINEYDDDDISYIGRVIADFVPNFVAMATGVGRSRICLASFNSPTPKTPWYTQKSRGYLLYRSSYSRFCPKFRCHGNRGHLGVILKDAVQFVATENYTQQPKITSLFCVQLDLWQFTVFLNFPHNCIFPFFFEKNS